MSRTYKVVIAIVAVLVVGYGGWRFYQGHRATKAGIISEDIAHNGDVWQADFKARVPAPEQQVFDAVRDVEKTQSEGVRSVKVISQNGNTKTVEMEIRGAGGQPVTLQMEFQYDPANQQITYHTLGNPALETKATYKFADEGSSTLITYNQTTKMLQQLPVPDGVVKEVIRSIFIAQLEGLKRTLNLASEDTNEDDEDM